MNLLTEEEIFAAAVEKPAGERASFLDRVCGGDAALRADVEALINAHDAPDSLLAASAIQATIAASPGPSECPGMMIGFYKLLEQIGEGGMGVVYVAEQTEPVRRRVALKIIKPGMDTKQVIARFEAERQALAMMDHPHIAKVLDAGTTDAGRPYFVMELVRGLPVTEYCDKARLSPRQRLELFIDVCHAVQHAHQKGVIHRDLKPSNVMITVHDGRPVAKVIDFGVAKAVGQQLTERTVYTAHTQLVGTPLYMSPEQADFSSQDVDTRSDVYSLGVLLYELLTGQTPFDKETLTKAGFDEMRRIIREDEPPCPSRRFSTLSAQAISTVSQHRSVDERHLGRVLRGELDWIVMKALEKDRSRRYESASALAADIQRYLSDEPVLACPPTTMYRLQKFARKHKPVLVTATAIAACLVLGTTVSAWQAVRATTAEAQANANATEAQVKAKEATAQRDEVKALADKLAAKEQQLQRTLYAANMKLAKVAWDEAAVDQTRELLELHRANPGERDLRGFEWHYLNRLCNSALVTFKGHSASVYCVAFSPDGTRVASSGRDRTILWDPQTGRELFSLNIEIDGNHRLAFSPDGTRLATPGYDSTSKAYILKVWDPKTGQELWAKNRRVSGVAYSPDGKHLAIASGETLSICDAQTGQELRSFKIPAGGSGNLAFSPDGKRLAANTGSGMRIWDAETGEALQSPASYDFSFSPDGKHLATANWWGKDRTVYIRDVESRKRLVAITGHPTGIRGLAYSADGKRLATAGEDRLIKVWNTETGEELMTFRGAGDVNHVAFSPDGTRLASASQDGMVKVWDANTSQEVRVFGSGKSDMNCVSIAQDGKTLAVGGPYSGGNWPPIPAAPVLKVLNAQTGQELFNFTYHTQPVNCVAYSSDGKMLASGSADQKVMLWDTQSGKNLLTFTGHTGSVVSVAFSPDGTRIASIGVREGGRPSSDQRVEVKIWDANSGRERFMLQGHSGRVSCVAFSPDGQRLATHSRDGTVKVWDAASGQEVLSVKADTRLRLGSVAFSPDGKRLAATSRASFSDTDGGSLGAVKVWDARTGEEILTLKGHTAAASSVAFSPDGKRIASASGNFYNSGELKLWDAETGQELLTVKGGSDGHRVAFTPDGHRLVSVHSGTLKIYDATPLPEKP